MSYTPDTAPHHESVKKPYQAPKLVVMGNASEMTQLDFGTGIDGMVSPTANAS